MRWYELPIEFCVICINSGSVMIFLLIKSMKRRGPITLPFITPLVTFDGFEMLSHTLTFWVWFLKNNSIQDSICLGKLYCSSSSISFACYTLSKAFSTSNSTARMLWPSSSTCIQLFNVSNNCVVQLLFSKNPYWLGFIILLCNTLYNILSLIHPSQSLLD